MRNRRTIFWACAVVVVCACAVSMFALRDRKAGPAPTEVKRGERPKRANLPRVRPGRKLRTGVEGRDPSSADQKERGKAVKVEKKKPTFTLDETDEKSLNEEQRKTIAAIRAALDNNDKENVLKLVQRLQNSDEWPDGIPKSIKMAAIEALGWFGSSCLPELAGFLADADRDVVQSAIGRYQQMLSDVELSDFERANILVQASRVVNDAEAMDLMLFELNNMRHSVAVGAMKQLMSVGNEATKSVLRNNIEFYTGEEGMDSVAKLDAWLKKYPDDEGDDEFYGGVKDSK